MWTQWAPGQRTFQTLQGLQGEGEAESRRQIWDMVTNGSNNTNLEVSAVFQQWCVVKSM